MTKREFFKFLKENGVFTTFYVACSEAFRRDNPKSKLDGYIRQVAFKNMARNPHFYVNNIKMWKRGYYGAKARII